MFAALPTHENDYVGNLDEDWKGSIGLVDNLTLMNSNYSLHAHVIHVKPNCIRLLLFIDIK